MSYWIVKTILGPLLRIVYRPWAAGTENVPRDGPAIIASNHLSFLDHVMVLCLLRRKVIYLAKPEYFTGTGLKRAFLSGLGNVPVESTGGGTPSEQAVRTALRVLAKRQLLGIYPEGIRSPDGRLYRGKTGVARLAIESGAPVIPCAMIGMHEFQPPNELWPNPRVRPGMRFGEPIDFSRYRGQPVDGQLLRTVTDEIMQAVQRLSGQEYVDEYAKQTHLVYNVATAGAATDAEIRAIQALRPRFQQLSEDVLAAWVGAGISIRDRLGVTDVDEAIVKALAQYHLSLFERHREEARFIHEARSTTWANRIAAGAAGGTVVAGLVALLVALHAFGH